MQGTSWGMRLKTFV